MDIKHRLVIRRGEHEQFINYLIAHGIRPKRDDSSLQEIEVLESSFIWLDVHKYIVDNEIYSDTTCIYAPHEIDKANWFRVRSAWRWAYPEPSGNGDYLNITYSTRQYCVQCGSGLRQKAPFRIIRSPNWGKKNFLMLNWIDDEIFMSNRALEILDIQGLRGYSAGTVNDKRADTVLNDIHQLCVKNIQNPGLLCTSQTIREALKCETCGNMKYGTLGRGIFYNASAFLDHVDIAKTYEVFGFAKAASRGIFINRKFYMTLKNNHLDNGLIFEPVQES